MGHVTARRPAQHLTAGDIVSRPETLAVEEPLEIRVNGSAITVTMRTPARMSNWHKAFCSRRGSSPSVTTCRRCAIAEAPETTA